MTDKEWYKIPIKGIPKFEKIMVRYYKENDILDYIITTDRYRNYKLYYYKDGQAVYSKHKSSDPLELEEYTD